MRALRLVAGLALAACGAASARPAPTSAPAPVPAAAAVPPVAACPAPTPEIQALVDRIDQDYDMLHSDYTPAVFALIDHNLAGACAVLELLDAPAPDTRLHAARVLEGVLSRRAGFVPGQGYRERSSEDQARTELVAIGYEYDAPLAARRTAAARWRAWVERALRTTASLTDTDGDGVPDEIDRCPAVPGAPGVPPEHAGCSRLPDSFADVTVALDDVKTLTVASSSAAADCKAPVLVAAADFLRATPDVEIELVGGRARVRAVKACLVRRGVATARIVEASCDATPGVEVVVTAGPARTLASPCPTERATPSRSPRRP